VALHEQASLVGGKARQEIVCIHCEGKTVSGPRKMTDFFAESTPARMFAQQVPRRAEGHLPEVGVNPFRMLDGVGALTQVTKDILNQVFCVLF
jgi:hypothetical protein